jgi:hypothetical protein
LIHLAIIDAMPPITVDNWPRVRERFCGFSDSLLRACNFSYVGGRLDVELLIDCKDVSVEAGWSKVRLRLACVSSYRFECPRRSSWEVMSNGFHVVWFDGCVGLELGDFVSPPASLTDQQSSRAFWVASSIDYSVEAY